MKTVLFLQRKIGLGLRHFRESVSSDNYDAEVAARVWGIKTGLVVFSGLLCGVAAFILSSFIGFRNPFELYFPGQVYPMFLGLVVQPISLFAMLAGMVLKKRASLCKNNHLALLVRPLLGGFALSLLAQQVYSLYLVEVESYAFSLLAPLPLNLLKTSVLYACWGLIFLIATLKKGVPLTSLIAMFFSIQGVFFGLQFIPDFGLLSGLLNRMSDFALLTPGINAALSSLLKIIGFGVFSLFLFENIVGRLEKLSKVADNGQANPLPPPIPESARNLRADTEPAP